MLKCEINIVCKVPKARGSQEESFYMPTLEDSWDELDYIDLENFIEYQESLLKPPSDWDNLAKQLGQTGARCPDDWDNGTAKSTLSLMQKT